jgi:hypothetical protein
MMVSYVLKSSTAPGDTQGEQIEKAAAMQRPHESGQLDTPDLRPASTETDDYKLMVSRRTPS